MSYTPSHVTFPLDLMKSVTSKIFYYILNVTGVCDKWYGKKNVNLYNNEKKWKEMKKCISYTTMKGYKIKYSGIISNEVHW